MPRVEFKPKIPAFDRAKTVHVLDRAVTVIGQSNVTCIFVNVRARKLKDIAAYTWINYYLAAGNIFGTTAYQPLVSSS
jgi:hypothetical protein